MSGIYLLSVLAISILLIIVLTARFRIHAFIVLVAVSIGVGLATGLSGEETLKTLKDGFGDTLGHIGIIILLGTVIGTFLEKTGAALSMARFILDRVGEKNTTLAITLTGYIVSIPLFCDSGFVILSPLNRALADQGKKSMAVMAVALASALYCTHCLIPPHPGATAAAGIVGADLGRVMIAGLILAIPGVVFGYMWATRFASRYDVPPQTHVSMSQLLASYGKLPNPVLSFLPVLVPVALIALRSFALLPSHPFGEGGSLAFLNVIGDPVCALFAGLLLALFLVPAWSREIGGKWVGEGVVAAGEILAITAAGGAFGAILRTTPIGAFLSGSLSGLGIGFLLPFVISAALKTAQGSSTVAVITTASLIAPLLEGLGLASGWGPAVAVLSMGAGSMIMSHANDSFFWVVTKFSDLDESITFKVYTTATFIIGLVTIAAVSLFSLIVL